MPPGTVDERPARDQGLGAVLGNRMGDAAAMRETMALASLKALCTNQLQYTHLETGS